MIAKKLLSLAIGLGSAAGLWAQWEQPCGTPGGRHPWWQEYARNREHYNQLAAGRGGITFLPTTLHIVCNDDGRGHGSVISVLESFCRMNRDFADADFHFFLEMPLDFIHNSAFNVHDTIVTGGTFCMQYNVANTFNPYFVASPAGYCGYSVRYADAVTVNYGCADGHTLSHEIGHDLLLEHPFYGWEGGISHDGSIPADYTQPAPPYIYVDYSMHNTYNGPSVVDTVEVENVPRSGMHQNCYTAGDGFCDTEADYLNYRWLCNGTGESSVTQVDPLGNVFRSKGEWIMSYSDDNCQQRFSPEQIAAARAFVFSQRQSYLYNQNPVRDSIPHAPILEGPLGGALVSAYQRTFRWGAVPGATHYVLEVTQAPGNYGAAQLTETVITTDTFFISNYYYAPRAPFLPYAWRVKAFNQGNTCAPVSAQGTFTTSNTVGVQEQAAALPGFLCYPNPVGGNGQLTLQWDNDSPGRVELRLLQTTGQTLMNLHYELGQGRVWLDLTLGELPAGVYVLHVATESGSIAQRVVVEP